MKNESNKQKVEKMTDSFARECIAFRMRIISRVLTNTYDSCLRPLGVKVAQLNIMVVTALLGVARPIEVCERLQMDVSTLSRNVERMKRKGWLETVAGEDLRAQPFQLTKAGLKMLEESGPAWKQAQKKAKQLLGEEGVTAIDNIVERIRSGSSKR